MPSCRPSAAGRDRKARSPGNPEARAWQPNATQELAAASDSHRSEELPHTAFPTFPSLRGPTTLSPVPLFSEETLSSLTPTGPGRGRTVRGEGFALSPGRMLSRLGLSGFPGRGALLKGDSDDWSVCAGHAHCLLMDSSLPAWSDSAARGGSLKPAFGLVAATALAQVPRGVEAFVRGRKEAAHCDLPHQKAKHWPSSES